MSIAIGDILKNKFTGEFYRVKKIRMNKVTLEAKDIPDKGWFGDEESLELVFDLA